MTPSLGRALERPVALVRVAADRASYRELRRLRAGDAAGRGEVELRIGRLNGRPVFVREGTGDADRLWEVFVPGPHVPPARVQRRGMHLVWVLGANIGLEMADLALRWPEARIVGVERDPENAALARRNFEAWDDRCELIEADVAAGGDLSLVDLLERSGGGPVAYVRMDVGGAERELLTSAAGWASEVGCIKVEVHGGYSPDDCLRDLQRLGFEAKPDRRRPTAVVGVRDLGGRKPSWVAADGTASDDAGASSPAAAGG